MINESRSPIHDPYFTLESEDGFRSPVVEASSDPRNSRHKHLGDQAFRYTFVQSNWNWTWKSELNAPIVVRLRQFQYRFMSTVFKRGAIILVRHSRSLRWNMTKHNELNEDKGWVAWV